MDTAELDYSLPDRLIAQRPAEPRDAARLLVVDRASGTLAEDTYRNVARYLRPGDCLVLNDTRVVRARLRGHRPSGGQTELFLLREDAPGHWRALVRPSAKVKEGTPITFTGGLRAVVLGRLPGGQREVVFDQHNALEVMEAAGEIPLPPYIHRDTPEAHDLSRYQTVYAAHPGAVAAPTAGLHFTPEVFASLDALGVRRAHLTLHVGYGTFKPITADRLEDHQVDPEIFTFPDETARILNETRAQGGRIVAVGTTATRVLETQWRDGAFHAGAGETDTYIYPPYQFGGVDILQTNFHLPKSSLLALVAAFCGTDLLHAAYAYAVENEFRFYSYGDAMLVL